MKFTDLYNEINIDTATKWLKNRYKDVPGIWEQFDLEDAANSLDDAMNALSIEMCGDKPAKFGMDGRGTVFCEVCGRGYSAVEHWWKGNYDDLPVLDLMCIMADAKM